MYDSKLTNIMFKPSTLPKCYAYQTHGAEEAKRRAVHTFCHFFEGEGGADFANIPRKVRADFAKFQFGGTYISSTPKAFLIIQINCFRGKTSVILPTRLS